MDTSLSILPPFRFYSLLHISMHELIQRKEIYEAFILIVFVIFSDCFGKPNS